MTTIATVKHKIIVQMMFMIDPQDYQNHALSGIGTFTQCKLCDMYCFNVRCQEQFHIATFDIAGDAPASKPNDGMTCFNSILSH